MPLEQLTLETLQDVKGGLIGVMLQRGLARIAQDIEAAPDIPDWRKLTLEIRAKPVLDQGQLEDVALEFVVSPKTPARVTSARMTIRTTPDGEKQLHFERDSLDNPRQQSLLDQVDDLDGLVDELHRRGRHRLAAQLMDLRDGMQPIGKQTTTAPPQDVLPSDPDVLQERNRDQAGPTPDETGYRNE